MNCNHPDYIAALGTTVEDEPRCPKCGAQVDERWNCCEVLNETTLVEALWNRSSDMNCNHPDYIAALDKLVADKPKWSVFEKALSELAAQYKLSESAVDADYDARRIARFQDS